ncbi:hypothetical protein DMENIID0001_028570 [Sergentomyia squamirostris]
MGCVSQDSADTLKFFLRDVREVLEAPTTVSPEELSRLSEVCDLLMQRLPATEGTYLEMRSAVKDPSRECPYRGLPVAHLNLRSCRQSGSLQKAERRTFLDFSILCTGRYFGGFLDGWLLLYGAPSGELRPRSTIHVSKAWDCGAEEDFKWPERVFAVEDFTGTISYFQTSSIKAKQEWLKTFSEKASEDVFPEKEEDGIYVEPTEVSGPTRAEVNRTFNYDTPKTPPRRVESPDHFRNKYEDIKSRIASQLLLTPPGSVVKSQPTPPPVASSSCSPSGGSWWFRRRRKGSQTSQRTSEVPKNSKKGESTDPTYEIIEAK